MEEYVKRKYVAEMLENAAIISDGEYNGYCTEDVNLDSIPAADVAPVRHEEWVRNKYRLFECTLCKGFHIVSPNDVKFYKFCPNCGAKMDGGEQK